MIIACLIVPVFLGIFSVLKKQDPAIAFFIDFIGIIGLILAITNHGGFSLIDLRNKYANSTSEIERERFLAAGEAIIASKE